MTRTRRQGYVFRRNDIKARRVLSRSRWKGKPFTVGQSLELDVDHFAFFRAGLRPFFGGGPFAARSSMSRTASSRVTASGFAPFGNVALVEPSVTYGP
jgi:hypothetical protein